MEFPTTETHSITVAIHQVREGNPEGFRKLFESYGSDVARIAQGFLRNQKSSTVSEGTDVAQEVFTAVWKGLSEGHPWMVSSMVNRDGFKSAVYRMVKLRVKNTLRDARTKRRSGGVAENELGQDLGEMVVDKHGEANPADVADGRFLIASIELELRRVAGTNTKKADELARVLHDWNQGLHVAETAAKLGCSERTANRLREVVKQIMTRMIEKESEQYQHARNAARAS